MQKIVLALQHATRLVQRIRDSYRFIDLVHDAEQLMTRVELAAESAIAIHHELKEARMNEQLKCSGACKGKDCPNHTQCPYQFADLGEEMEEVK